MMNKLSFNLGELSTQRTSLMGLSILFVLFCHAKIDDATFPCAVLSAFAFLDIGVDMFFLFSGIGIFFSLYNSEEKDTYSYSSFIIKRLKRILIPYLILETPFWIWFCVKEGMSPLYSLYYLSFASFWLEHIGLWFVALLLPLYFVSPFLLKLIRRSEWWVIGLVVLPLVISVIPNEIENSPYTEIFNNIQIVSSRIPCYVIGLWIGKKVMNKEHISIIWFVLLLVLFVIFKFIPIVNTIYRGWMIAIVLSALLASAFEKMKEVNGIYAPMTLLGKSTLFIYISYDVCKNLSINIPLFGGSGTTFFLSVIGEGIFMGILYYYTDRFFKLNTQHK